MRTDTLAIVITDIKGYTAATSAQTHTENARMLRRIERVVLPVVGGYSGRVIKSMGDAYMIVFRSPTEAVRCAMAVQDRLHQHNTNTSTAQAIHLRIAINFGEVRVHRGDVFGDPVNVAARLEGVTPADEIYLSQAVYLAMNRSEAVTERVGDFELKGIPEPVTVYKVKSFAHLAESPAVSGGEPAPSDDDDSDGAPGSPERRGTGKQQQVLAAGLPYGGTELGNWRRLRWIKRAYNAMGALAVLGILGAGYLRYRPSSDYSALVADARAAAEAGKAMEVLAAAGQIPVTATAERDEVRRFRRKAVAMLLEGEDMEVVSTELEALLAEDQRDAEALVLRALLDKKLGNTKKSLSDLEAALKLDAQLGKRQDVIEAVVEGYTNGQARKTADVLVEQVLDKDAIPALAAAVKNQEFGDRTARRQIATRLEKLGASHEVDWVQIYIDDLKSTNCKTRKTAIAKLAVERDERSVGPLMKVADSKGCHAKDAKRVAASIVK